MKKEKPDYKNYPLERLFREFKNINRDKYPDRYHAAETEINDRLSNPHIKAEIERQQEEAKYQTFWPRVGAGFLDGLLFYPISLFAKFVIYPSSSLLLIATWDQFWSWGVVVYSVLMHGLKGQTIGKMICKVRVYDITEKPLSMKQAFFRDIGSVISNISFTIYVLFNYALYYRFVTGKIRDINLMPKWFFIFGSISFIWFLLEIITMLSNNKRRAFHDYIAGSVVCRVPNKIIQRMLNNAR